MYFNAPCKCSPVAFQVWGDSKKPKFRKTTNQSKLVELFNLIEICQTKGTWGIKIQLIENCAPVRQKQCKQVCNFAGKLSLNSVKQLKTNVQ